jgi:beta-mannosidase
MEGGDAKDLCRRIGLDGDWLLEGMEIGQGLARQAWEPGYEPADAFPARVPGIVQAALLEAGRIEDPYWEMNNERILWVERKEWWYFRRFRLPADLPPAVLRGGGRVELVFEGLTYHADIWLNGAALGSFSGMFLRRFLDVTGQVRPGEANLLAVRLRALENSWEDRPAGAVKRGTVRSSGVVAPFSYWWNWSPHLVPIGIWKPVHLKISGAFALRDPHVRTRILWDECGEAEAADLEVSVELACAGTRGGQATVRGRVQAPGTGSAAPAGPDPPGATRDRPEEEAVFKLSATRDRPEEEPAFELSAALGPGEVRVERVRLRLERPRLWWPNGMGPHPLYGLGLEVLDEAGARSDRLETEFGVRELALERNPDDLWVQETSTQSNRLWSLVGQPYPWTFVVNHRKVFIRGSNWLPADNLFRFTEERYRMYLDLAEEANLNMLRVWGGGIHETEAFYRLCDRKGLLTWTEFWLACADYPDMPRDLFVESAADMVKVIRNHPCLALYCGGNEFNADAPQNRGLVDRLAAVVRDHDPDRRFRRGSPYKGDRHGGLLMLPTRTSNKYNGDILNGDQRLVLFRAEVAVARSAPLPDSIRKFIGEGNIWPINRPIWQYHHGVVGEQERDAREYGGAGCLERWLMSGQIVHGQVHRHNMEYCRQSKFHCSGCMQWQLNASWPAMHREIVDWWGIPKPAYYAYKRACRDYLVTVDLEKYVYDGNEELALDVYAVSDRHRRTGACTVSAAVYDARMERLHLQEGRVELGENESVRALTLRWRVPGDYLRRVFFIHAGLRQDGALLAENLYWCGTSGYARKEKCLNLNGPWEFQVGPEARETEWKPCRMPSYWALPPRAPEPGRMVFYRKRFDLPAGWRGTELEMFCQGFEGNDRVAFNGAPIGATEEELTVTMGTDELLFTEKWAERRAHESREAGEARAAEASGEASGPPPAAPPGGRRKGERQNVRISSDPFVVPNLIKRFYRIPPGAVRWGGRNALEVVLYGEHATGISEPVFIRPASTEEEKRAIRALDDEGVYLAGIGDLPEARLTGALFCDHPVAAGPGGEARLLARLANGSPHLAFFTALTLRGADGGGPLEEAARVHYSDNYTWLLPGEERDFTITVIGRGTFRGRRRVFLEIGGWNVPRAACPQEVELRFE